MFSFFGIAVSGNTELIASIRNVLETLAITQSEKGHIPSLVHDKDDLGASDTTPLFLLVTGIYRNLVNEPDFLKNSVEKALLWMEYQSPTDQVLVAQQATSDWRDEQWVLGYGLFVNTIVYSYLRLFGQHERAGLLRKEMHNFIITAKQVHHHVHEGLVLENKPYYALWSYKVLSSERFDLLGNSLAILSGLSDTSRSLEIIDWIEKECEAMYNSGDLVVELPPNFFPFIKPGDIDWRERYSSFNLPGDYHNGGIWPFICGLYIAALVAAEKYKLAENKLLELTRLITISRDKELKFGFNEWIKAQDGRPKGQDWQTWSAALYLYAAYCVEEKNTAFFDIIRNKKH